MTKQTVTKIDDRSIWEYSVEELKAIIGNFEREYNETATGEIIHNEILGYVKKGTVDYALKVNAIEVKTIKDKYVYFVKLPGYTEYQNKLTALAELNGRREYAINKAVKQQER